MAQIKIYGHQAPLEMVRERLSDCIHQCVMDGLGMPENKRFHRFFPLQKENFIHPTDRSEAYTIIEISMMSGRSAETRKNLIALLFKRIATDVGISPQDVEISIHESSAENWGFRGQHGDEIQLSYSIDV